MPDPFHEVHQVLQAVIDQLPSSVLIVLPPSGRIACASAAFRHLERAPEEWPLARALGGEVLMGEAVTITRADGTRATWARRCSPSTTRRPQAWRRATRN